MCNWLKFVSIKYIQPRKWEFGLLITAAQDCVDFFKNSGYGKNLFLADFWVYGDTRTIYKMLKSKKCEGGLCFNKNTTEGLFLKGTFQIHFAKFFCVEIFSKLEYLNQISVATWKGIEQQSVKKTKLFSLSSETRRDGGRWHLWCVSSYIFHGLSHLAPQLMYVLVM